MRRIIKGLVIAILGMLPMMSLPYIIDLIPIIEPEMGFAIGLFLPLMLAQISMMIMGYGLCYAHGNREGWEFNPDDWRIFGFSTRKSDEK